MKENLETSHNILLTVLDSLDAVVYVADIQTYELLFLNKFARNLFGDSVGKLCWQVLQTNQTAPCDFCSNNKLISSNGKIKGVYVWEFQNTVDNRWYDLRDRAINWIDGRIVRLQIATDITDRKQAEEALRKSETLLTETGQMAKVGGWEVDTKTLEVSWTEEIYRIYEVPLGQKPLLEEAINYFHPDDRPKLETAIQKALDHGEPYDMEIRLITAKGKHLWTHTICKPITVDGKTVKLTGTFQDITERKQAEEALHQYEHIVSSSTDMLALLDKRFNYLAANEAYIEAFKLTPEQLIGNTVADVFGKEFFNTVIKPHGDRCLGGEEINYQSWFDFPAHGRRYMNVTYYPYYGEDNMIMGFVVNGRNITERKLAEEEREKLINELRGALKEIKTLRGILPLCSFCKKIRDDKGYWEQVDVYIHKHLQADISHGICPECAKEHYPDLDIYED